MGSFGNGAFSRHPLHSCRGSDHGAGSGHGFRLHPYNFAGARWYAAARAIIGRTPITSYELQVTNAETPKLEARKMERVRGGLRVAKRLALIMPRYGTAQEQLHTSSVAPGEPPEWTSVNLMAHTNPAKSAVHQIVPQAGEMVQICF